MSDTIEIPILSDFDNPSELIDELNRELTGNANIDFSLYSKPKGTRSADVAIATIIGAELALIGVLMTILVTTVLKIYEKKINQIENEKQRQHEREMKFITVKSEEDEIQIPINGSKEEQEKCFQLLKDLKRIQRIEILRN